MRARRGPGWRRRWESSRAGISPRSRQRWTRTAAFGIDAEPGVRVLGLGRRALLGLGGGRTAADDRHRAGAVRGVPDGRACDGPAFPRGAAAGEHARAAGAGRDMASGHLRLSARGRCCPTTSGCRGCRPICSSSTWRSNGKGVTLDGPPVERASGPVVWGEPGTNGQHAFFQLLHQGTDVIPCEFLVAANGHEPALRHHHRAADRQLPGAVGGADARAGPGGWRRPR